MAKKAICVLAGCVCPETNDPAAKSYCPDWVVNVPEHERDLSGRVTENYYTGCQRRRILAYMLSMTAQAGQAAASADKAATQAKESKDAINNFTVNPLLSLTGMIAPNGILPDRRLEGKLERGGS